jgi:hypothetical protein
MKEAAKKKDPACLAFASSFAPSRLRGALGAITAEPQWDLVIGI